MLAAEGARAPAGALTFSLRPEPLEPLPRRRAVALFTTGAPAVEGVEPIVASANLARRSRARRAISTAPCRAAATST